MESEKASFISKNHQSKLFKRCLDDDGVSIQLPPTSHIGTSLSSSNSSLPSLPSLHAPHPPDGGWGWIIVLSSFLVHFLADGACLSFGVMFVSLLKEFNNERATAAWVSSLFTSVPLLASPVASVLIDQYDCRAVTIGGGIAASFGFFISYFARSVEMLYFTLGVVAGLGLSCVYVAAIVAVSFYFERRRSLATGLATSGSGIGMFIFAPLTEFLLNEYGWRGVMLIISGLFLNLIVCGALFRPLDWKGEEEKLKMRRVEKVERIASLAKINRHVDKLPSMSSFIQVREEGINVYKQKSYSLCDLVDGNIGNRHEVLGNKEGGQSEMMIKIVGEDVDKVSDRQVAEINGDVGAAEDDKMNGRRKDRIARMAFSDGRIYVNSNRPDGNICSEGDCKERNGDCSISVKGDKEVGVDTTYISSRQSLRVSRLTITCRGCALNSARYTLVRTESCPDVFVACVKKRGVIYNNPFINMLRDGSLACRESVRIEMMKDPAYAVFWISNFLLYLSYDTPYLYLADMAVRNEIAPTPSHASFLLSIIGILNTFGLLLFGFLGDLPQCSPLLLYAITMIFCGASATVMPLVSNYYLLAVLAGIFGFCVSTNYALTSIILVELMGLDQFTGACGLVYMGEGIANLIGPPIFGWLFDITGHYTTSFAVSGISIIICGVMLFPILRCYDSKKPKSHVFCCQYDTQDTVVNKEENG